MEEAINRAGGSEESVRSFFEKKIDENLHHHNDDKEPINSMFTYGTSGNCVHLHLPVELRPVLKEKGIQGTIDTVNLYLLDAVDKISRMILLSKIIMMLDLLHKFLARIKV